MNILGILKEKFNPTEPIFDYEIYDLGYSDRDIDDTLQKNVFEEFENELPVKVRTFSFVEYSDFFKCYIQSADKGFVVSKYYINDWKSGYLNGFCSLNKLGLSTQNLFTIDICSSRVSEYVEINSLGYIYKIYPDNKKKYVEEDNWLNMYITAFKEFGVSAFDCSYKEALKVVSDNLNEVQFIKFKELMNLDDAIA